MKDEYKTLKNINQAFENEAINYVKYLIYASIAKKEGYYLIGNTFNNLAREEFEHACIWFRELGMASTTLSNLKNAIRTEDYESDIIYKEYSNIALKEDLSRISKKFLMLGSVELRHSNILKQLLKDYFEKKENKTIYEWTCTNCGHLYSGLEPPVTCPLCDHSAFYFKKNK